MKHRIRPSKRRERPCSFCSCRTLERKRLEGGRIPFVFAASASGLRCQCCADSRLICDACIEAVVHEVGVSHSGLFEIDDWLATLREYSETGNISESNLGFRGHCCGFEPKGMISLSRKEEHFGEREFLKYDGGLYLFEPGILILPDFGCIDVHGFGEDQLLGIPGLHHGVIEQKLAATLHNLDWKPEFGKVKTRRIVDVHIPDLMDLGRLKVSFSGFTLDSLRIPLTHIYSHRSLK
jgi:hypothetical protein